MTARTNRHTYTHIYTYIHTHTLFFLLSFGIAESSTQGLAHAEQVLRYYAKLHPLQRLFILLVEKELSFGLI